MKLVARWLFQPVRFAASKSLWFEEPQLITVTPQIKDAEIQAQPKVNAGMSLY